VLHRGEPTGSAAIDARSPVINYNTNLHGLELMSAHGILFPLACLLWNKPVQISFPKSS